MTQPTTPETIVPAAGEHGSTASSTGGQPDWQKQSEENLRRFTGLQGKFQQTQAELQAQQVKLHDQEEANKKLTGEREALTVTQMALEKRVAELSSNLEGATSARDRLHIIATEFPELLPFEKDKLLPVGKGDELKGLLKVFSDRLRAQGVINTQGVGATPAAPASTAARTKELVFREMTAALRLGEMVKYDGLYAEHQALLKQ